MFGADFVTVNIVTETLRGIRYKLIMMGVHIPGPLYIYGEKMLVINNTQRHESTLKKKSNYICYHDVSESVAMGESLTGKVVTNKNCNDLATKILYGGKRKF